MNSNAITQSLQNANFSFLNIPPQTTSVVILSATKSFTVDFLPVHKIEEFFRNFMGNLNSLLPTYLNKVSSLLDLVKQDTLSNLSPFHQFRKIPVYMMPGEAEQPVAPDGEQAALNPEPVAQPQQAAGQAPPQNVEQLAAVAEEFPQQPVQLPAPAPQVALAPVALPINQAAYNQIRNLLPPAIVASLAVAGIVGVYAYGPVGLVVHVANGSSAALRGISNFVLDGLQISVHFIKGAWKVVFKPFEGLIRSKRWVNALEGIEKIAKATGKTANAVKEMFKALFAAATEAMKFFGATGLTAYCGLAAFGGGNNNQPPQPPPQPPAAAV